MDIKVDILGSDNAQVTVGFPAGAVTIDLQREMSYSHDIDGALERHAASEATWEFQAIQKAEEVDLFFEQTHETYLAHLRTYARYAARGSGEKTDRVTIEMTKDFLIRLYSERTSAEERERLSKAAFRGFTIERLGSSKSADAWFEALSPEDYGVHLSTFYKEMFAWQDASGGKVPYWYETMTALRLRKQREKEEFQVLARAYRTRGYLLKQGAENAKARMVNIGGMTVDAIVDKTVEKLRRLAETPGAGSDPRIRAR